MGRVYAQNLLVKNARFFTALPEKETRGRRTERRTAARFGPERNRDMLNGLLAFGGRIYYNEENKMKAER